MSGIVFGKGYIAELMKNVQLWSLMYAKHNGLAALLP
jgi:hypothetical protein